LKCEEWGRMEKFTWTDGVRKEEILQRAKEERNFFTSCIGTAF